jgi:hypothetical protein
VSRSFLPQHRAADQILEKPSFVVEDSEQMRQQKLPWREQVIEFEASFNALFRCQNQRLCDQYISGSNYGAISGSKKGITTVTCVL